MFATPRRPAKHEELEARRAVKARQREALEGAVEAPLGRPRRIALQRGELRSGARGPGAVGGDASRSPRAGEWRGARAQRHAVPSAGQLAGGPRHVRAAAMPRRTGRRRLRAARRRRSGTPARRASSGSPAAATCAYRPGGSTRSSSRRAGAKASSSARRRGVRAWRAARGRGRARSRRPRRGELADHDAGCAAAAGARLAASGAGLGGPPRGAALGGCARSVLGADRAVLDEAVVAAEGGQAASLSNARGPAVPGGPSVTPIVAPAQLLLAGARLALLDDRVARRGAPSGSDQAGVERLGAPRPGLNW